MKMPYMYEPKFKKRIVRLHLEEGRIQLQKNGCHIDGPKKLGTLGASYFYPIFMELGIITEQAG